MIEILDSTLREGEQTPFVNFLVEEKMEIARLLDLVGVEMIEAGDPSVSPKVAEAIEQIAKLGLRAEIVAHSLARRENILRARDVGAQRVAIFYATSSIHLNVKLRKTPQEVIDIISEHVAYARSLGLKVRYTPEDASRTDLEFLIQVCNAAIQAGADRISFADTVGVLKPEEVYERIQTLRQHLLPCAIDLHFHNDHGLALANAMAGIRAGANCIHTTVNGMGERCGIPDLAEVIMVYHNLEGVKKYRLPPLMALVDYVEKTSGFFAAPNKPVSGQNAFSHKSGVHTNGVLKDPRTYEPFDPALLGRERKLIIDKYTGKSAVLARLAEYGVEVTPEELERILIEIKNLGDSRKQLFDADILDIAERVTGRAIDIIPREIEAMIMLEVESHVYTTSVVRRLRSFRNVKNLFEISGEFDVSAMVSAENVMALNNLIEEIRRIPGVKRTETRLILKKYPSNGKVNTAMEAVMQRN
ncbi:MAG: Lrp/AsnC ligand binding domain-containing protein [Anaerolineales bacterium]|nr:Lrp/AsnC ligand binding domain-containing protein [Anaerolineales bacterium]